MRICLIQMNSGLDKKKNLMQAEDLISEACKQDHPDWICLPETFNFMGGTHKEKLAAAELPHEGETYIFLKTLAQKYKIWIHGGSILEKIKEESRCYNTTFVFDRNGSEVARYRKIHLFDIRTPQGIRYEESSFIKPGENIVTYACENFLIGCATCYDLRFSSLFQALSQQGVDVIALPAAFTLETGKDHWEILCRARAIETQTYFCGAAQTGIFQQGEEHRFTYGHSLVADPWGQMISAASEGPGYILARLEKDRISHIRQIIPVSSHRVSFF